MALLEDQAAAVLRHYPRIYVACHWDHRARRGQGEALTARDQTILAHVPDSGVRANVLAQHLNIAASTLSAALKRLAAMKCVALDADEADARGKVVRLTARGRALLTQTSVLDLNRVRAALRAMTEQDRAAAVRALALLADAAQMVRGKK